MVAPARDGALQPLRRRRRGSGCVPAINPGERPRSARSGPVRHRSGSRTGRSRSARKRTSSSAAAATRRAPIADPAGTPSDRASVRCARNGLGVEHPAAVMQRAVDGCGELRQLDLARAHVEPQRSRPRSRRERPGAADRDVERWDDGGCLASRRHGRLDAVLERRAKEAEGDVEAIEADPSNVPATAGHTGRPDLVDDGRDPRLGVARERHRHEQPPPGDALARIARRSPRSRHSGRSPVSRSQTARSVRRTSSARSRSRQPRTSTVLSSSALYVSKKCSISTRRCGRTCSSRSMCC